MSRRRQETKWVWISGILLTLSMVGCGRPTAVEFRELGLLSANAPQLNWCCDPAQGFPQLVGTIEVTAKEPIVRLFPVVMGMTIHNVSPAGHLAFEVDGEAFDAAAEGHEFEAGVMSVKLAIYALDCNVEKASFDIALTEFEEVIARGGAGSTAGTGNTGGTGRSPSRRVIHRPSRARGRGTSSVAFPGRGRPSGAAPAPTGQTGLLRALRTATQHITIRQECIVSAPAVAMDGNGNGVIVYVENGAVVADRYVAGQDFLGPETISDAGASSTDVAMDGAGNIIATWLQQRAPGVELYARRYSATAMMWEEPILLQAGTGGLQPEPPQVAMSTIGFGMVVWSRDGAIWGRTYSDGWADSLLPVATGSSAVDPKRRPRIAISTTLRDEVGVVVYEGLEQGLERVYANVFERSAPGGPFRGGIPLDDGLVGARAPDVACGAGVVVAVWEQDDGAQGTCVYASDYVIPENVLGLFPNRWSTPQCISGDETASTPRVTIDSLNFGFTSSETTLAGALAVFQVSSGIHANRFAQSSWQGVHTVSPTGASASLASARPGQVFTLFGDDSGSHVPTAASYSSFVSGWRGPRAVDDTRHEGDDFLGDIAGDATDTVIAAWLRNGTLQRFVWLPPTARFTVSPLQPQAEEQATLDGTSSTTNTADAQIESYHWQFDNRLGTGPTIMHAFETPGEHFVSLTVVDDWGMRSRVSQDVRVDAQPPSPTVKLQIIIRDLGLGTVIVTADGVVNDCGGNGCTLEYPPGTKVTLEARLVGGFGFSHWEGPSGLVTDPDNDSNHMKACLTVTEDTTVTAHFFIG